MMNELWQRLVVRGLKNPKTWIFYPILIFGMLMIVQFNYNDSLPILDLDQLDKRTGTLIDVHTVGRAKEPWIVLKRGEETFRYYFSKRQLPEIKKHIGQEIVVWSQAQLNMGKFRFQNITRQVQVGGKLIQDYEKNIHPYLNYGDSLLNTLFMAS